MTRVLVAYATRHGSTAGIAERVAARLGAAGLQAEARPAAEVRNASAYDAFVVGGAAYMTRWLGGAIGFVERNRATLAARPTWLFSSGRSGRTSWTSGGATSSRRPCPRSSQRLRDMVRPRGEMVFFGAIDPAAKPIGLAERLTSLMPAARDALPKGDFRDWAAIDAWADEVAAVLGSTGETLTPS